MTVQQSPPVTNRGAFGCSVAAEVPQRPICKALDAECRLQKDSLAAVRYARFPFPFPGRSCTLVFGPEKPSQNPRLKKGLPVSDSDFTPEVPEPSDEQALNEVDLTALGVTSEMSAENLLRLFTLYNDNLAIVEAAAEAAKAAKSGAEGTDPKSIARTKVNAIAASDNLTETVGTILDQLFAIIDADPTQAAAALTGIGGIVKFVSDVRDTEITRVTAEIKAENGISADTPDAEESAGYAKLVAKAARGVLTKLIGVCAILGTPVPDQIKTKKNAAGDLVPDLKDLPKGRSSVNTVNLGRGSKARRVRYNWVPKGNPEGAVDLREGITLAEIAVAVISVGGKRVLSADLAAMFGTDKIDQFSETPWVIEFETGTLMGHLPKAE